MVRQSKERHREYMKDYRRIAKIYGEANELILDWGMRVIRHFIYDVIEEKLGFTAEKTGKVVNDIIRPYLKKQCPNISVLALEEMISAHLLYYLQIDFFQKITIGVEHPSLAPSAIKLIKKIEKMEGEKNE